MRDAADHGKVVLSAIIGGTGSIKALDYALGQGRLTPDHFVDPVQAVLFTLLQRYADQTRGIMSREALDDLLRSHETGKALMYGETYTALARSLPRADEFIHSTAMLRQLAAERDTGQVLAQGMQVLQHGVRDERGRELRGHEDAREYVLAGLAAVERDSGQAVTPEGDVTGEGDEILDAYAKTKTLRLQGKAPGILFGLPSLDEDLDGGIFPGEMGLILAWTSAGKSSLCVQAAWNAAVMQGKNVVIFTTEQLRTAVRVKLAARHSRLPKFGLARGINDADIRAGRLDQEGERALAAVLADWKTGGYGKCNVVQLPDGCTVGSMAARFASITRQYPVDFTVVDYLQLFAPDRTSREAREREDQSGIVKSTARFATSCNNGQGVALLTPWQVNRTGRQNMQTSGRYDLSGTSQTAEASNTPDLVLGLVDREEDTSGGRRALLEAQVLKKRGGARGGRFPITADFATSFFEDREEADEAVLELD
jgi:replicative DNA helicase